MKHAFFSILAMSFVLNVSAAIAAEEGGMTHPLPPGVTEEQMARAMELATPGEGHAKLEPLVGEFKTTATMWMGPEAEAQVSEGSAKTEWILDGRFIRQEFKGDFMGKPFEGIGITGYSNMKKEYSSIWIDNVSADMMKSTSTYDEESGTFAEKGSFACAMTGEEDMKYRAVTRILDENRFVYEMYHNDKDGNEFKAMEILYERQ